VGVAFWAQVLDEPKWSPASPYTLGLALTTDHQSSGPTTSYPASVGQANKRPSVAAPAWNEFQIPARPLRQQWQFNFNALHTGISGRTFVVEAAYVRQPRGLVDCET
jgi:hypothetical protein